MDNSDHRCCHRMGPKKWMFGGCRVGGELNPHLTPTQRSINCFSRKVIELSYLILRLSMS